jgi:hypothetical protein
MHADLVKLLDLQAKDSAVAEVERRLDALREETGVLDQALQRAQDGLDAAKRAAADAARRRDELEQKIESYRVLQERRQQRLEHVRNPKEASTLMAELDLARSVVAKEESDWVRSSRASWRRRGRTGRTAPPAWSARYGSATTGSARLDRATWSCRWSAAPAVPATRPSRSIVAARSGLAPWWITAKCAARSCTHPMERGHPSDLARG